MRVECEDGYSISVVANEYTYCTPRVTGAEEYYSVELGFPSEPDELINEYAQSDDDYTETVYPYVPASIVRQLIDKHGGMRYGSLPLLAEGDEEE